MMEIQAGDLIYIKENAIDIRSGKRMKKGDPYSLGSRVRCKIQLIDAFHTHGKYHLPVHVTRVKCINQINEVVWEIQPKDVEDDIIRFQEEYQDKAKIPPYTEPTTVEGRNKLNVPDSESKKESIYFQQNQSQHWKSSIQSVTYIPSPYGDNKTTNSSGDYNSKFITNVVGTSYIGENTKVTYREVNTPHASTHISN